jgi:hypothetical protein
MTKKWSRLVEWDAILPVEQGESILNSKQQKLLVLPWRIVLK